MLRKRLDQEFFWDFKLFLNSPWMNVHSSLSELPQLRGFHHLLMAFANRVFASSVALRAELRPQWGPWRKPEEEAGCLALVQQGLFSPSMTRQAWSSVLMHCRNAEMDSQQGGVPPRFTSRKESSWPSALGCRVGSCPGVCAVRGHKCCQLQRVTEESCLSSLLYCLGCVTDTLLSSVGVILR